MKHIVNLLVLAACSLFVTAVAKPYEIAIIIDDVGGRGTDGKVFSLSKDVTFAILPHTPYSKAFSYKAAQQNREVMLHMPMESLNNESLGPEPLLANMYPQQLRQNLLAALSTVPHAVGVNNHMGSKLTQMTLPMKTVMDTLAQNNMFFIDSRTTKFTKAGSIANAHGVKVATRHVFLDHERSAEFMQAQFDLLIRAARERGKAIGIAHPYPETMAFLPKALENLPSDIRLIRVSQYLEESDKFRINPRLANTQKDISIYSNAAPR